jgi:hypothetical protein
MRRPKYLSPTNISKFYSDIEEWYLSYLAEHRPPRYPQTQPMAIGAAFDAYWKSYMVEKLFGFTNMPEFELTAIFENQVEPHNRDWAIIHGKHAFESYKLSGALASLMFELEHASHPPRFEFTIEDKIYDKDIGGIPILGKPDLYFITKGSNHIVYDAKVNGYCSKSNTSPKAGYIMCKDGWSHEKHSRTHNKHHKDCQLMMVSEMMINIACYLEDIDESWATQLATYGWLLGEPVGSNFVTGIEQLVSKPNGEFPLIRIASHRLRIGKTFQELTLSKYAKVWKLLSLDDKELKESLFEDMTPEQSSERCDALDNMHKAYDVKELIENPSPRDIINFNWFKDITRRDVKFPYKK